MSGHIEKKLLKDGTTKWKIVIEVSVDPATGKRNRIYETVDGTKKQAELRLRSILNELEGNTYVDRIDKTFGDWLDEWMTVYIGQTHSPNTLKGYRYIISGYIKPKLGNVKIQGLTTTQLQKFYNEIKESSPVTQQPISAKTVKNVHMVVQAALNKALKLGLIKKNPDHDIQIPKPKKYVAEVYNNEEIQRLIEYAKGTDMELALG